MAVSARITGINIQANGVIILSFDNGQSQEFNDMALLQLYGNEVDDATKTDLAQRLMVRWWLERDPNLQNINLALGHTLTFDMSSAEMIGVRENA